MDKKQAIAVAEKFAERVAKEFNPRQILLFGSYLDGTYREYSDIDVAIIFDKDCEPDSWSKAGSRMYAIRREIKNTDIEPHLLRFSDDDPTDLAHRVMETGKMLYPKN